MSSVRGISSAWIVSPGIASAGFQSQGSEGARAVFVFQQVLSVTLLFFFL